MELMVLIGVGYALYTVYVHVIVDKGRSKPKPPTVIDAPAEPVVTAMPMATVAPTSVPTVSPAEIDCKKVKADCIEKCSDKALPTPDFGWKFQRCLRACVEAFGC
ncbi:MAG: hypothetical protein IPK82_31445 [Polyangiaceae bacterium]|nr:hypothetical protein [Polyangiaceae bacterium]